jgi:glycosyltransferase involved in cell wall biosynthesis
MAFISIIIPVYKVEKYLCKCIESVIQQNYANIEIILVDDGSPDKCPQICDEYAFRDDRIRVIHKTNGGLSDARNYGTRAAKGDYLMFLDSDDYWEGENCLQNIIESLNEAKPDVLLHGCKN